MSNETRQQTNNKRNTGIEKAALNELSTIKHVVAVVSGKGGVGKSLVSGLLALSLRKKGFRVGIMDADITGPSIPRMFGVSMKPNDVGFGMIAPVTGLGIRVMSVNLLLENEDDPVIWRGPVITRVIRQFWTDVVWGDLDYLIVDLPPGTGDAPLTVMQSIPLDGLVVVSAPQDLVLMVVRKAIKMAAKMNIPILGLIENMSGVICGKCGEHIEIFGKSKGKEAAKEASIPFLGSIPIDPKLAAFCDAGEIEKYNLESFETIAEEVAKNIEGKMK